MLLLIVIPIAGSLFTHNTLALTLGKLESVPQMVLSLANDSPTAPHDTWKDVDISSGWADPRINGGRLLDVSRMPVARSNTRKHDG